LRSIAPWSYVLPKHITRDTRSCFASRLEPAVVETRKAGSEILVESNLDVNSRFFDVDLLLADAPTKCRHHGRAVQDEVEMRRIAKDLLQRSYADLQTAEERYRLLVEHSPDAIMLEAAGDIVFANRTAVQLYRAGNASKLLGRPLLSLVAPPFRPAASQAISHLRHGEATPIVEEEGLRLDGSTVDLAVTRIAFTFQNEPAIQMVARDISTHNELKRELHRRATHDGLTGLANRALLREHMLEAVRRGQLGDRLATLCLDLDQFKIVNDTLGHPIGDKLLQQVADRLRHCTRATDTVARLGGDEFVILLPGLKQIQNVSMLAERLIDALRQPFNIEGHHILIGTSIGIAIWPEDGADADTLIKSADVALYHAKGEGRGIYRYFQSEMDRKLQENRMLELDLRRALAAGEFELHYQPMVDVQTRELTGFEALLRWNHPKRGLVSSGEFISVAENTGLILPIGEWVLRQACAEAMCWPDAIKIAVNLSPAQFKHKGLAEVVVAALQAAGLPPPRLELEITEAVLLRDNERTLTIMGSLRDIGVRMAMDDFGTGYSSLSYLRKFPFDKIKIDRSFVRGSSERPDSAVIIRAVVELGAILGIATTAEGVETAEDLQVVLREGCSEAQGYYFGRPRPACELSDWLAPNEPCSGLRSAGGGSGCGGRHVDAEPLRPAQGDHI
jgi:diguanylate cyclase (GGDEF)-like protein/PAS domain S-box-containing protein